MENKSLVAGVLSIVSGFFGLLAAGYMVLMIFMMSAMFGGFYEMEPTVLFDFQNISNVFALIYGVMGGFFVLLGILGIIGGVYAIKKKYWGLGLAAAISGTITFFPCGIAAIIMIAMSKEEFNRTAATQPVTRP
ncbi:MAG: hypothetical protein PHF74_08570 [Dehalococcoidales bacterium]|nr:hypothetical protein [Dehalococcoidales bacterium]